MPGDDVIRYRVKVLGPIAVEGPDRHVDPGGPKPRLLLAMLVAQAGGVVTTERLIDGLWEEDPPPTARKTLQVHVSNLRRSIGPAFPLETARAGYRIDTDLVAIDAVQFEEEVRRGGALRESSPAEAGPLLAAALARWTGPAYADVAGEAAVRPEVARLDELRLTAVEQRIETDLRLGRHQQVLGELEALTTDHAYREHLRGLHMVALYRAGRQTDALRAYDRTRRILAEELGIDPSPELRQLRQQVLDQSPQLDLDRTLVPATGGGGGATDVGVAGSETCAVAWGVRGYELRERLGERHGVAVHRAYQASVGREVAIKIIPPEVANDAAFVTRFEADCRILAELGHPHIVGLYDYWRDPSGAYVVMPLLGGGTLERSLEQGTWGPAAALQLLDQVGSALSHAHRRGLIHGDLRPSNVILDADRNAFLSDFLLHGDLSADVTRRCDPAYTSPEVLAGRTIGPAADVYGLAVLTCHVLAGAAPEQAGFARATLPPGFDEVVGRAMDVEPVRRFDSVDDYLRALRRAFGADVVTPGRPTPPAAARNPYKGLRAFGEADAMDFFGRDELLVELVDRVSTTNLTVVVGPSGSGKSSLVRAGLIPAVRRGALGHGRDVVVAEMFPGSYPFEELESALLRVAVDRPAELLGDLRNDDRGLMRVSKQILPGDDTDLLLVIDQFEELFALTADEEVRRDFISCLVTVAGDERSRVRVVLTLRADFYDRPLTYPAFGGLVKRSLTTVTLPDDDSLARAIAEPARRVGLDVEPGLIPTILRDVASEPGALPLLQYALTELAEACRGELTVDGYHRTGGVVGALARRAEEIFTDLTPTGRDAAREVFVRLVTVSDDADDTRRRVRRTELEGLGIDPSSLNAVIGAFGSFRLLSFDHDPVTRGPTVEVAHEALIREWPRYRGWVEDRRDDLRTERRLHAAVAEWRGSDRDPAFLISGGRLERYEQWVESADVRLTADEQAFLAESRRHERARAEAATTRRRRVLAVVSLLAVLAVLAAVIALVQRDRADDEAQAATEAAATAEQLRVDAERAALVDHTRALMAGAADEPDAELRLLLALQAHDALAAEGVSDSSVTSALYQSAYDQPVTDRLALLGPDGTDWVEAQVSPDGSRFAVAAVQDGRVVVVDSRTGATLTTLEVSDQRVEGGSGAVGWDAENGHLLIGHHDGTIEIREPTGELVDVVELASGRAVRPLFARDGLLGYGTYGTSYLGPFEVAVVDRATGDLVFETAQTVQAAKLSPTARYLLVHETDAVRVIDTATWADVTPDGLDGGRPVDDVEWTAGGDELWLLEDGVLTRIDPATGAETMQVDGAARGATFVTESRDGLLVAVGGAATPVRVYETTTGMLSVELAKSGRLLGDANPEFSAHVVVWLPDRRLVSVGDYYETIVWDLGGPNAAAAAWPRGALPPVLTEVTPAGGVLFGTVDGGVEIFDAAGRSAGSLPTAGARPAPAVVSGDGTTVARPLDGAVQLVDVASGTVRATGPPGIERPLALAEDGGLLVAGMPRSPDDDRHIVAIVDGASGEVRNRIGSLHDGERGAFTSDGRTVLLPITRVEESDVSALWVVDAATGRTIGRGPPEGCITDVALASDDQLAATVGCDGTVGLYDVAALSGDEPWAARIGGDADDTTPGVGVTFGPDDETVIVTRQDGRVEAYSADADFVRLWSFDVGDHVGMPSVRDGMVWVGVTTPHVSAEVASGGAVAMPLDLDELVAFARSSVTRQLTDEECQEHLDRPTCDAA